MGLDSVELVMAWEEHFGIEITNEIAARMVTPRIAIDEIEKILMKRFSPKRKWTWTEIERDVCEIIVEQIGVTAGSFTLDSSFVKDMGVD